MLYLKEEQELFTKLKKEFATFTGRVETLARVRRTKRGHSVDKGTPIHHRMSPEGMLHEIVKKGGRLEATQNHEGWSSDPVSLRRTVGEVIDIINYSLFLGALCMLKLADLGESTEIGED